MEKTKKRDRKKANGFTDYIPIPERMKDAVEAAEKWLAHRDPWDEIKVKK